MLGPNTNKVLSEVSAPLLNAHYWTAYSRCGTPRIEIWANDTGGRLMAQMMANHWDITCCCGACYGYGHHFAERLTAQQIRSLGFNINVP